MSASEARQVHEQSDDYIIQAAIILKRMVPSSSFSNEMALVCAGAEYRRAMRPDFVLKLKIALEFAIPRKYINNNNPFNKSVIFVICL